MFRLLLLPGLILLLLNGLLALTREEAAALPVVNDLGREREQLFVVDGTARHPLTPPFAPDSIVGPLNGRWLYYLRDYRYVLDLETLQTRRVPLEAPFVFTGRSATNSWLLLKAYGTQAGLYRLSADGATLTDISAEVEAGQRAWGGPDDAWIAFVSDDWQLYRMRPDGRDVAALGAFSFACWVDAGRLIARDERGHYWVDVATTTVTPLGLNVSDIHRCWSGMIYARLHPSGQNALLDLFSGAVLWSDTIGGTWEVVEAGAALLWSQPRPDGRLELWRAELATRHRTLLAISPQPATEWQLTPAGDGVVFGAPGAGLSFVSLDGGAGYHLEGVSIAFRSSFRGRWSPDGQWILFNRANAGLRLWRLNIYDQRTEPVGQGGFPMGWTQVPDHGWRPLALVGLAMLLVAGGALGASYRPARRDCETLLHC